MGEGVTSAGDVAPVIAYLDTDIIIRHLTGDPPEQDFVRLLRALELYERHRLDFAESYFAACAEVTGVDVASFDRALDRLDSVSRIEVLP